MMDDGHWSPVPEALLRSGLPPRAIQVFGMLLRYADTDRVAWPRQSTIARDLGCSVQTVERAIRDLREAGWITVHRRGYAPGVWYHLATVPAPVHQDPESDPSRMRGTHPSRMRDHTEREPIEREPEKEDTSCLPSPPRTAVRREARIARDRDDALDPAKALDLWDAPATRKGAHADRVILDEVALVPRSPARRSPSADSPMGLALAWRARMQEARVAGALDTNVKALARLFRVLLDEQVTPAQIRAMTNLYAAAGGLRNPAVAPWRHFLFQRHLLLSKVREHEAQQHLYQDPDAYVYTPPTREQRLEADRAYQIH